MYYPNTGLQAAAADTQTAMPPTAADAFAMLQADAGLTMTQRRDRLSALAAVVRICRPVDDGKPSPSDIRRDAHLVPMSCATLNARLFSRSPMAFGFRNPRRFENIVSQLRGILRALDQHAPELPPPAIWSPPGGRCMRS